MDDYNPVGLSKFELDTPCLVIDKNKLLYNLQLMQQHVLAHNIQVRPHVKTHKCSKLATLQLQYGAIGVSAAKVAEAEVLIAAGIHSILITSPVVTPNKITRLLNCVKQAPETMIVVDNQNNVATLNAAAQAQQIKINVLIDIDPGIGRTGIKPEKALELGKYIQSCQGLELKGLQCYAGNLQHIKSYEERRKSSLEVMQMASNLVKEFKQKGLPCEILTGSGTGTYDIDIEASEVTEIQPGSYTVMDVDYTVIGSKKDPNCFHTFQPAMTLLTTVISANRAEHVTVDAGTKSIYVDKHQPKIIVPKGLSYDWGGFGDEHGKITAIDGKLPKLGDVLELIVPHCDPTINLFDKFFICENDLVVDCWDIDLRGKSQ
ncbi:alanine racemase [Legionella busanensis]|uniref:Alanine racemase n=1 Tax=Legionella busanensis TaxID=190655 RepID=A0A378JFS2_9GAMM|nr:DSD1 family PLP-dependent enzyme [Legionella busanensis]STX50116.1 alanine racemase [Legionella busanensis]